MSPNKTTQKPMIALLGQPNSGKSTLFNGLTGAKQRVGNWPGKTVEQKTGHFRWNKVDYAVTDLPGSYSLSANSEEEMITREFIASGQADVVCILVDSSQLARSLYMLSEFAGLNCPVILLLNLFDIAQDQGKTIDANILEQRLGIPVVPFVAAELKHYAPFYIAIERAIREHTVLDANSLFQKYIDYEPVDFKAIVNELPEAGLAGFSREWLAIKLLESDPAVGQLIADALPNEKQQTLQSLLESEKDVNLLASGQFKYAWIDELLEGVVQSTGQPKRYARFDRIATHKSWGKPLAILIIVLGLVASFIPATPIMLLAGAIPKLAPSISQFLSEWAVSPILIQLVNQVLLNTLYFALSMIGFVWGVNLVFGFLEEIGYMARVSYVFDSTMVRLGLQGKSVMPFIVSFGCTIGGVAGTRVINSWGQRVLTIALAWTVPCAATWAIVPMLSTLYFGAWAPLIVVAIFLIAGLLMWITAKLFGPRLLREEDRAGLIMELPPYHKPRWGSLLRSIFVRTKDILVRALRVIFLVAFGFWLLTYSSTGTPDDTLLYRFGQAIEPVTLLFGLSWQTFLAYLSSMVSKEAALGVLAALYMGGDSLFDATLSAGSDLAQGFNQVLLQNITPPMALAFIFSVTFNAPCLMAITSTYQETRSLTWTLRILAYYIVVSLVLAFAAYHVAQLFF